MPIEDQSAVPPPPLVRDSTGHERFPFPQEEAVPEKGKQEKRGSDQPRDRFILGLLRALSAWPS